MWVERSVEDWVEPKAAYLAVQKVCLWAVGTDIQRAVCWAVCLAQKKAVSKDCYEVARMVER